MFDTREAIIDYLDAVLPSFEDRADSYGEPGYGDDYVSPEPGPLSMVVLGSYWCRCLRFGADMHDVARHYPQTFERLEELGVHFEWYDEWTIDHGRQVGEYPNIRYTSKAYRTSGDSYHWLPSAIATDDGELITIDDDLDTWIDYVSNDPHKAIPSNVFKGTDLEAVGFVKHNGRFESGWHPGQTDSPDEITDVIREAHGERVDIVFAIDDVGQFDMSFSAYYRAHESEES